ncbi:hypothetical protein, partial [Candidatus Venteria ishoeyi]|uniref:hypothetical protein n=1 Tax=Candidatus Venteria ishoeyi TaxID=1899563 RepID=UPI00255C2F37
GKPHSGRKLQVKLQRWNNLLMRGKIDAPMYEKPFDLVRCQVFDQQDKLVFKNILWLIVFGKRRCEIRSEDEISAGTGHRIFIHFQGVKTGA